MHQTIGQERRQGFQLGTVAIFKGETEHPELMALGMTKTWVRHTLNNGATTARKIGILTMLRDIEPDEDLVRIVDEVMRDGGQRYLVRLEAMDTYKKLTGREIENPFAILDSEMPFSKLRAKN